MQAILLYEKLYSAYGRQGWWPASQGKNKEFEVCIGAILTQNTAWSNVEKAISSLKCEKALSCNAISAMPLKKLAKTIHSAGYHNQKAKYLKEFCRHLRKNYSGKLQNFLCQPVTKLRTELLSLKGIGPETADSIILYAAGKPVFVIDSYTKRIFARVFGKEINDYSELQEEFQKQLPKSAKLFNEFHALIVRHAKEHCRKKPECKDCFLGKECGFAISFSRFQ